MKRTSLPAAAAVVLGALAGCSRGGDALPEVRVHVSPDLPAEILADVAARFRVARVVRAATPGEAELAWLGDPAEALLLGPRLAPGSAPAAEGVPPRFTDAKGRFAPLAARARVLLVSPAAGLPFTPSNLRDLADPRARGRIALAPLGRGTGPVTVAALALAYGEGSTSRFLALLAANAPQLAADDADVRARIASGEAAFGLAGSPEGAQAAASARPLDVVYPDQVGSGAILLPTAVVLLAGARPAAGKLAAWLTGPDAERVFVARVPGLLPLRPEVPVPPGVEPASNLVSLPLDWEALAAETRRQRERLARWPDAFTKSGSGRE
jgi:iron(III) transport system substrate-binding protein